MFNVETRPWRTWIFSRENTSYSWSNTIPLFYVQKKRLVLVVELLFIVPMMHELGARVHKQILIIIDLVHNI